MRLFTDLILLTVFLWLISCKEKDNSSQNDSANKSLPFRLEKITDEVTSPVGIVNAGDGSKRLFIVEQPGIIRIIKDGNLIQQPFLDIKSKLIPLPNSYSEMGLLGLAFHPNYKTNGRFFVYYSAPALEKGSNHTSVISEFKVSPGDPNVALTKEKIILTFEQPESNHNGGCLAFGPDGYLYISAGDGGGSGDPHGKIGNAQNLSNLLGKILRIDIDAGNPYAIPTGNPFKDHNEKKEIYAYGLRNPWRFSFDFPSKRLFAGDVGQNKFEEVDIIEKGKNYGWRHMEGLHIFDADLKNIGPIVMPIHEYGHEYGISITGGYVYRGKLLKELKGTYIFGDWNGNLSYLTESENKWIPHELLIAQKNKFWINSFGVDEDNELYLATQVIIGPSQNGVIYKLIPNID